MKKVAPFLCIIAFMFCLLPANAALSAPMVIKMAHPQPIGSPEDIAFHTFSDKLGEISGGTMKVDVYPALQLGSIVEMFESTQLGVIEISGAATAILSSFCDDVKMIDLPYMLPKDVKAIDHVLNNTPEGKELLGRLRNAGLEGAGFWCMGTRLMSTKNNKVEKVADMKGLKFRIMESPMLTDIYKSWGALPVPIAYAELYNALQQGVVEGQENPIQSIYLNNLHEVQKYIFGTFHATQTWAVFYNKAWYDGLTPQQQGWLKEAELVGRAKLMEVLLPTQAEYTKKVQEYGCVYYEFNDAQIKEFADASRPVWNKYTTTEWQKGFAPRLVKAFENYGK